MKILVCIFHYDERTLELNKYCWNRLGFNNIKIFSSKSKFYEKLIEMANYVYNLEEKYDLIIKSDADELVFDGVHRLVEKSKKYDMSLGLFFDRLMNNWRNSGPKIYKPIVFDYIVNKKIIVKDVLKTETELAIDVKDRGLKFKTFNIPTCLHEFAQYPSKILNVLINRYHRGHLKRLYSKNYLLNSNNFKNNELKVFNYLFNYYIKNNKIEDKKNCNYIEFQNYDKGVKKIKILELEVLRKKFKKIYKNKIKLL